MTKFFSFDREEIQRSKFKVQSFEFEFEFMREPGQIVSSRGLNYNESKGSVWGFWGIQSFQLLTLYVHNFKIKLP